MEPSELWIDQYRGADQGPLSEANAYIVDELLWCEQRQRKRRSKDAQVFYLVVEIIVANLAHGLLRYTPQRPVYVSRNIGKRRTLDNPSIPQRTFVHTLDLLQQGGFLIQALGSKGHHTSILATDRLSKLLQAHGVDFGCFRRLPGEPLIQVSRKVSRGLGQKAKASPQSLIPSEAIDALQDRMARLNAFLRDADLGFVSDATSGPVDIHDRTLVRRFVVHDRQDIRLDQCGRLFKGFWQTLKRNQRIHIRIQGEPIADLDYSNMHPRMCYHLLGLQAPDGDLYDLTGLLRGYNHSNPKHRGSSKTGLNSLLNGGRAGGDALTGSPVGTTAKMLREAILAKHPALRTLLGSGLID